MVNPDSTLITLDDVPHPGETVAEYLEVNAWSQRELSRRSGVTTKVISEICNGKTAITPPTAISFEKVLGRPASFWLGLQSLYDEHKARDEQPFTAKALASWEKRFPVREMRKLKFSLPDAATDADSLLQFFGVSSPSNWDSVWGASSVAYRQSKHSKGVDDAVAAWVREVEITAQSIPLRTFDESKLRSSVNTFRGLTRKRVDDALPDVQALCARVGVAFVIVPALPRTGISGCARWLQGQRATIGLSLRYKTDDQLWFTFFHELGHVLLHRARNIILVDNVEKNLTDDSIDPEMKDVEQQANVFARDQLIPRESFSSFSQSGNFKTNDILSFAESIGIAPGIVVGRLQWEGLLSYNQGNFLKQKLDWQFKED